MNSHFLNRILWGLFIIVIGVGFMLRQGGIIDFNIGELIRTFWPVILLFLGFQELLKELTSGKGSYWGAGVLLVIGFVFLGRNLDWLNWSIGDIVQLIWPAVIILVGLRMIFKPKKKEHTSPADEWKEYNDSDHRSDGYVPPAPPLHPDPTQPPVESDSKQEAESARDEGMTDSYKGSMGSINLGKHPHSDKYYDYKQERMNAKAERHSQRAEKIRSRIEHKAHGCGNKGREEWWNYNPDAQTRSGFIGDIYMGSDYWELKPLNISHFIGDTVLDLTKAQIPPGETKINISSFIGDVKVFLPNDFETGIRVVSSAFIGDVAVLEEKEGGIFKHMNVETPYFHETEKRIKLQVSTFIGDVRVTKVG